MADRLPCWPITRCTTSAACRGGVSADYFGVFAGLIEKALGADKDYVAMMSNGTSGDINNISFRVPRPRQKPMQRMNEVAQLVADAYSPRTSR